MLIHYRLPGTASNGILQVMDVTGRLIGEEKLTRSSGTVQTGESWNPGLYLIRMITNAGNSELLKVVKTR